MWCGRWTLNPTSNRWDDCHDYHDRHDAGWELISVALSSESSRGDTVSDQSHWVSGSRAAAHDLDEFGSTSEASKVHSLYAGLLYPM